MGCVRILFEVEVVGVKGGGGRCVIRRCKVQESRCAMIRVWYSGSWLHGCSWDEKIRLGMKGA